MKKEERKREKEKKGIRAVLVKASAITRNVKESLFKASDASSSAAPVSKGYSKTENQLKYAPADVEDPPGAYERNPPPTIRPRRLPDGTCKEVVLYKDLRSGP